MRSSKNSHFLPNISYVIGSLGLGGAEVHLSRVLPTLAANGFRLSVISLARKGAMSPTLQAEGIDVIEPPAFVDGIKRIPKLGRFLALPVLMGWLFAQMLRRRRDIVHFFLPEAYILGMPCAWLSNPHRSMLMSRRSLNDYQDKYPLSRQIERAWHQRMRYVLGNSRAVIAQLRNEGVSPERLKLIYNGLAGPRGRVAETGERVRRAFGIHNQALVMVIVANLIPYKGHMDLLQALSLCNEDLPSDWVLLCIGRDDGILDELKAMAGRLQIAEHIEWLGMRQDVADILQASDLGLLVSHQEGFSNAILEYMAAGIPVVATDVGGNAEAVANGETGMIVPAQAPEKLANAVALLAKDEQLRNRYGMAGVRRMQEHFSLESCVAAYEALYVSLLNGRASGGAA